MPARASIPWPGLAAALLVLSLACAGTDVRSGGHHTNPGDEPPAPFAAPQTEGGDGDDATSALSSPALAPLPRVPAGAADDTAPRAGLGAAFHAGRRDELRRRLREGVVLVRGLPATRDYTAFEQDKTFFYLTGVESPGAALLMDVPSGLSVLYLPARDPGTEAVEGELWDARDTWAPEVAGLPVKPYGALLQDLGELLEARDTVWVSQHPTMTRGGSWDRALPHDRARLDDPLDGRPTRERALEQRLVERFGAAVRNMAPVLSEMRMRKQPEELDALRRAAHVGALAMAEAIRSTRAGLSEREIEGVLQLVWRQQGSAGPAYLPIVAGGERSVVLHAAASGRLLRDGDVLLVDAGCEVDHATTDITRTWPVSGRFDERQAALYDAVLAAQEAAIAAVRPGSTLFEIDEVAGRVLRERGLAALVRHFTCHFVGLEVHDVGNLLAPLEPGMVFTVEPGVYDEEAGIGIRIEDVVVVTEDGCEVLTRDVPVGRQAMEALVAEPGVLDWMAGRG